MVILEHIFPIFLYNMVDITQKIQIKNKILFSNLYCVIPSIFMVEKNVCQYVLKNANILKK
jgi:hypothetical protein